MRNIQEQLEVVTEMVSSSRSTANKTGEAERQGTAGRVVQTCRSSCCMAGGGRQCARKMTMNKMKDKLTVGAPPG